MYLNRFLIIFLSLIFFQSQISALSLVPWPQSVQINQGSLEIKNSSRIVYNNLNISELAKILSNEIYLITGKKLPLVLSNTVAPGDIYLKLSPGSLVQGSYVLNVSDIATIQANDYKTLALGTTTLLQAIEFDGNRTVLPLLQIKDFPKEKYRGVLLDIAREPYSLNSIKKQIILNHFYKIPYLVLHLNDNESITFKLAFDPKLGTTNYNGTKDPRPILAFSKAELLDLVKFADQRGVTLIPEIEMPGHGAALIRARPDLFKTGEYHYATLNIANSQAVNELKTIVKELANIFVSSPYIHLGGDEADFAMLNRGITGIYTDPYGNQFIKVYDDVRVQWDNKLDYLTQIERAAGRIGPQDRIDDAHAVFRDFLNNMNAYVKSLGKKSIIWESYTLTDAIVPVSKEIIVMPFDQFRTATFYINSGFDLINASWSPLYIVLVSLLDGSNGLKDTPEHVFNWNKRIFDVFYGNQTPTSSHTVSESLAYKILGAQLSLWENTELGFLPAERPLLPAMSEKLWNPDSGLSYFNFNSRYNSQDKNFNSIVTANLINHDISDVSTIESTSYTSFYQGKTYLMKVIQGKRIALLIPSEKFDLYDKIALQTIVSTYDNAYNYYMLATGQVPNLFYNYKGKLSIAVVDATCGGGCGYLGSTGIEIQADMWEMIYKSFNTNGLHEQLAFYELGRNFWLYRAKLNGGNPNGPSIGEYSFTTGFAVYMRFKSMAYAKAAGANFGTYTFENFLKAVKDLVDIYVNDPSFTFENTLHVGKSVGFGSGSDLFASFLFRLERDYGGKGFSMNFWKYVEKQPTATTDSEAIDNFFTAACMTAESNLTNLFVNTWRWPISQGAIQKVQNLYP